MIKVCRNKKKVIRKHFINIQIDRNTLYIYIDDNEINDKIEALIWVSQINASQKKHFGNNEHFIVYFGELEEIDMIYQIAINTIFSAINI